MEVTFNYKFQDKYDYSYDADITIDDIEEYYNIRIPRQVSQYFDLQACYENDTDLQKFLEDKYKDYAEEEFEEEQDEDIGVFVDDVMWELEKKEIENPTDEQINEIIDNLDLSHYKYVTKEDIISELKARLEA